jgi:LysM repeat protein
MDDVDLERLVLPALLALLILGMFLILVTSGGGSNDSLAPLQPVAAETTPARKNASTASKPKPTTAPTGRFAKVAEGDTATSIAQRAGLSVDRLADLNPSIDLDSLRLGQTLKLVP